MFLYPSNEQFKNIKKTIHLEQYQKNKVGMNLTKKYKTYTLKNNNKPPKEIKDLNITCS